MGVWGDVAAKENGARPDSFAEAHLAVEKNRARLYSLNSPFIFFLALFLFLAKLKLQKIAKIAKNVTKK